MTLKVIIRNTSKKDISKIVAIQRESFPDVADGMIYEPSFLEDHINLFPEGQFCAELEDGKIVGSATSLIVLLDPKYCSHTWYNIAGNRGIFKSHDPKRGDTLYADDICSHPNFRRMGIATKLFNARKQLAIEFNLKRIIGGGRLYNYCEYADKMSADDYATKVIKDEIYDPVFSFQLKNGFKYVKMLPEYLYDSRSLNYAPFIEWINPKYHPRT